VVVLDELIRQAHRLELVGSENFCEKSTLVLKDLWGQDANIT
jgi:hypothetical protein